VAEEWNGQRQGRNRRDEPVLHGEDPPEPE